MSQNFQHWPFTFRGNVGIGRPEPPIVDEAVKDAAAFSGADQILNDLPLGLGTLLAAVTAAATRSPAASDSASVFRAKYRRAEILIVDERTSAVDAVAEQRVFDRISLAATTGQTIFLITHRLHEVRHADLIHVLKDGRVAESGTFTELMDDKTDTGDFRNIQAAAFDATCHPKSPARTSDSGRRSRSRAAEGRGAMLNLRAG
ncbi:hypothetical protein ACIO7M_29980 [Streptomyces toxytricini]|uniref:Uncharacterized protein n=1 Tax=Streptomyces toxytricini TaxID=67369 RepID=A0ABW8ERR7_STRT5